MRKIVWFLPAVVIPLTFQVMSSDQPSSTATVATLKTPQLPLLQQLTPSAFIVNPPQSPTIGKKQHQKAIAQKYLPKKLAENSKNKTNTRPYTAPAIEIQVEVAQNIDKLAVASSTVANLTDSNGQLLEQLQPNQSFQVNVSSSTILFQEVQIPSSVWIEPTRGGAVFVGDRWYRGKLLLVAQGEKLLAVNYVDLEQYLASVVGSEMSAAAPIEALKAQAIAARSYALVHTFRPANQWYDLGSDERHQVYKGIATEYNTTHQAVSETTGQILSYQGGVIESLYGATQAIIDKAHKGAGMSQSGAYEYAARGYDYQQILAIYYPGTEIARLEAKKLKQNRD